MNKIGFNKEPPAPAVWQVWLTHVRFEGKDDGKKRPVLVTETNGPICTILEITSKAPTRASDVPVTDLDIAGLGKDSVIRVHKKQTIPRTSLGSYMGYLSYGDKNIVKDTLRKGIQ